MAHRQTRICKKTDIPLGEEHRWLTVTDAAGTVELLLEPSAHPAVGPFQQALVADGIPCTMFGVHNAQQEYERLCELGVNFTQPPTPVGGDVTIAVFEDTCGNLIQLVQQP